MRISTARTSPLIFVLTLLLAPCVANAAPFPRLLPPASDFRLTLREDSQSKLPLGPSCGGEAGLTLTCRAFTLTLQNIGASTIRISQVNCQKPSIRIDRKEPNSSSGWWPVSTPENPRCTPPLTWTNLRLRPGESTTYETRLVAPYRRGEPLAPGSYILRAEWPLWGCTDKSDETDCLTPLEVTRNNSLIAAVDIQEPVLVQSNELQVISPTLPDLGELAFGFDVTAKTIQPTPHVGSDMLQGCTAEKAGSISCVTFHYLIRNLGTRPVLNSWFSCSDSNIEPEYRISGGGWKALPQAAWSCTMNVLLSRPILAGSSFEGDFSLRTLTPGFDTSLFQAPGDYEVRFTLHSNACFASPDASFCLDRPEKQPSVQSREIAVHLGGPALTETP